MPIRAHCCWIDTTHSRFNGLEPTTLSPPTNIQCIFVRSIRPKSSRSGSIERKRTDAGAERKWSILEHPYCLSSTLTPHQMCLCELANLKLVLSMSRIRPDRLVSTWYVCQEALT